MGKMPVFPVIQNEEDLVNHLEDRWKQKGMQKIEWLVLEAVLRQILRMLAEGKLSEKWAIEYMDEAIAAHTGRGHELPEEYAGRR
jgi:hypothetical protein